MSAAVQIEALKSSLQPVGLLEDDGTSLVKAWNKRQELLAAIEARGAFRSCEYHSPAEMQSYDALTDAFENTPAESLTGLLAKMWVALDYSDNTGIRCNKLSDGAVADAIRRGDTPELIDEARNWDFGPKIIWSAIRDVQNMLRFLPAANRQEAL